MNRGGSDDALRSLYQEVILDHYRRPRHRGELDDPKVTVHKENPTCGDEVTLHVRLEDGRVVAGKFNGQGCSISMAAASMMIDLLEGKTAAEAARIGERFRQMLHGDEEAARDRDLGDLRALAGVAKFPARVRCAMLAWTAWEEAAR